MTVIEGFALWFLIRGALMRWYRSQTWFYSGRDAADVLKAQMGNRFGIEKWSLFIGFGIAVLSNLILNMWWKGEL